MADYNPIDYKVERPTPTPPPNNPKNFNLFDFKISKWNIVLILIILIQFVLIYRLNDRISFVEDAFKKQLDSYQNKLDAQEKKLEKLKETQTNSN